MFFFFLSLAISFCVYFYVLALAHVLTDFFFSQDNVNRPLEAQWFYVPELDEDQERATLLLVAFG